jgi:hypothetical protein
MTQTTYPAPRISCNAGAAPVRGGDLGYGSHLDRDGADVACE